MAGCNPPIRQVCARCRYEEVLPYPSDCPTCRDGFFPVRMALGSSWQNVLAGMAPKEPEPVEPVEVFEQTNLLGGLLCVS
jgi:hypothetical protein